MKPGSVFFAKVSYCLEVFPCPRRWASQQILRLIILCYRIFVEEEWFIIYLRQRERLNFIIVSQSCPRYQEISVKLLLLRPICIWYIGFEQIYFLFSIAKTVNMPQDYFCPNLLLFKSLRNFEITAHLIALHCVSMSIIPNPPAAMGMVVVTMFTQPSF